MFIPTSTVLNLQPGAFMSLSDPISPGQPLRITWEIYAPRGLRWGTASASVEFDGAVLYESGALPNRGRYGQFDVGEQDISITPPESVAGDFYRIGDHQLHLIVRGDGGQTYGGVFTFSVVQPSIDAGWWQWTAPSPPPDVQVSWNIPFSLAGNLSNPTDALFHATFALIETPNQQHRSRRRAPANHAGCSLWRKSTRDHVRSAHEELALGDSNGDADRRP